MPLRAPASQQVIQQSLQCAAPWLMCGLSIVLATTVIHDWVLLSSNSGDSDLVESVPMPEVASQLAVESLGISITTFEANDRSTIPWFGILKPEEPGIPPPPEVIEISRRNLHLIGISTSTSPDESFALIKSVNGNLKALKAGDAAEPGVELVELLPNAAILKAGDHWEKLYLGDPPPGIARSVAGGTPTGNNVATRTAQPGTGAMTISGMKPGTEISTDPKPRRNDNPNLSNRDIRERMNALMATLQQ